MEESQWWRRLRRRCQAPHVQHVLAKNSSQNVRKPRNPHHGSGSAGSYRNWRYHDIHVEVLLPLLLLLTAAHHAPAPAACRPHHRKLDARARANQRPCLREAVGTSDHQVVGTTCCLQTRRKQTKIQNKTNNRNVNSAAGTC